MCISASRPVRQMASALSALAKDQGLEDRKREFEDDRAELYESAIASDPPFEGTFLAHPFLEAAIRRRPPTSTETDATR